MIPVLTIDGPSGSGKGTVCRAIACSLGWHYLDSGAMYRLLGLAAHQQGMALDAEEALAACALGMDIDFQECGGKPLVFLAGEEVSLAIRSEEAAARASQVAALPAVREALLEKQRSFRQAPGLVADGRDMGTVVFPQAPVKVFLTASAEERAKRRYLQLKETDNQVTMAGLLREIRARDERDANRKVAPLKPAADAHVLDSTGVDVQVIIQTVLDLVSKTF